MDSPDQTAQAPAPRRARGRVWLAALLAFAVTLIGGILYLVLIDVPWIRRTGLPSSVLMVAGTLAAAFVAWRYRSWVAAVFALLSAVATALFVGPLYLVALPHPAQSGPLVGDPAPALALPNEHGELVTLAAFRGRGPVLLVFYRGFW